MLPKIVEVLSNSQNNSSLQRNTTWTLVNFFRADPLPSDEVCHSTIPLFLEILKEVNEKDALLDALWVLCYLVDKKSGTVSILIEKNIVQVLQKFIKSDNTKELIPALRIIGSIT